MRDIEFRLRRDFAWRWARDNPVLGEGEPGYERQTGRMKIGDGVKRWNELDYFIPKDLVDADQTNLEEHIHSEAPHPAYDDGPSFILLYENAKV